MDNDSCLNGSIGIRRGYAADSAITMGDGRSFVGAQKLLAIPHLKAGVSVWQYGSVCNKYADEWLQNFIDNHLVEGMGIAAIAELLASEINREFGVLDNRMGFHVAGIEEFEGQELPSFYHVHNGHYRYRLNTETQQFEEEAEEPLRLFNANPDCPASEFLKRGYWITRNGDFLGAALLQEKLSTTFPDLLRLAGIGFPYPKSLRGRGEYLRFWITLISEIYRLSDAREPRNLGMPSGLGSANIGGPVTILTISRSGIEEYYAK